MQQLQIAHRFGRNHLIWQFTIKLYDQRARTRKLENIYIANLIKIV